MVKGIFIGLILGLLISIFYDEFIRKPRIDKDTKTEISRLKSDLRCADSSRQAMYKMWKEGRTECTEALKDLRSLAGCAACHHYEKGNPDRCGIPCQRKLDGEIDSWFWRGYVK